MARRSKYPRRGEDCEYTWDCPWGTDGLCDRPRDMKCELDGFETDTREIENA